MAHWQGFVQGVRGPATRLGSKKSGLDVYAASWQGRISISGYTDEEGVDQIRVSLQQHVNGAGAVPARVIYDGPISGK